MLRSEYGGILNTESSNCEISPLCTDEESESQEFENEESESEDSEREESEAEQEDEYLEPA